MSGLNPTEDTMCADHTTYSTQSNNALCATQGIGENEGKGRRGVKGMEGEGGAG